jgi:hypothetical protein
MPAMPIASPVALAAEDDFPWRCCQSVNSAFSTSGSAPISPRASCEDRRADLAARRGRRAAPAASITSRNPCSEIVGSEVAPAEAVADRLQARQLFEAVEEIGAHAADHEQRALGVLQRPARAARRSCWRECSGRRR